MTVDRSYRREILSSFMIGVCKGVGGIEIVGEIYHIYWRLPEDEMLPVFTETYLQFVVNKNPLLGVLLLRGIIQESNILFEVDICQHC